MVERFDVAVEGIVPGANIGDDGFRGDVSRIDHTAQVQAADDAFEGDAVDFGDDLGVGDLFGVQGQQDIFLVDAGQRNKGFGVLDAFLLEQCLVGAVAVDDDGFGQQNTQFLTAGFVDFDDFNRNAHLQQLARQIVGCFAAADNHSAFDMIGFKADGFQKVFACLAGSNKGEDIVFF